MFKRRHKPWYIRGKTQISWCVRGKTQYRDLVMFKNRHNTMICSKEDTIPWYMSHDWIMCVTWLIHICHWTHSYVWHDSFIYLTSLIHTCDMTHPYVRHDSFTCVTWMIHMCATWLIQVCDMTDSYVCDINHLQASTISSVDEACEWALSHTPCAEEIGLQTITTATAKSQPVFTGVPVQLHPSFHGSPQNFKKKIAE